MGITYRGHLVIGDEIEFIPPNAASTSRKITPTAGNRKRFIPVTERIIKTRDKPVAKIENPAAAREFLKDIKGSGLVLLDTQHNVIGWLQMSPDEMRALKANRHVGVKRLLTNINKTNTSAVIARIEGDRASAYAAANNLAAFTREYEISFLDAMLDNPISGGPLFSTGENGGLNASSTFFSMPSKTTNVAGMSVADVEAAINKAARSVHESIGLKIEVVATNEDLPEDIRADIKPDQRPHGVLAPDGTVYLVTGNIPDAKAARIAFAHEVVGHVGVNRIVENWPSVIRKIQLLVKAGNKHAKEIDADVRARYPNADADTYAKEFIALAAERKYQGPLARLISQIRAAIRKFFSKFGINLLTDGDIDIILADSEKYLRTGGQQGYRNAGLAFSQPAFGLEDDAMSAALKFISENTPAFKYPKSNATTMTEVAKDVGSGIFPGIEVSEVSGARMTDDLDRIFTISFGKKGKKGIRGDAIVRQYKNGTLETDVSLLKTGEYGSLIYQIIGDYAHNTGRVFVGDRHGLSYVAQIRRTEGMLSSALRWGTTAHLRPHNLQLDPEVQGVRPLKWKVGDDAHNLRELALTQSETMHRLVPELKNFGYNDKTGKFTRKGRSVDDKTFDRLVKTSRLTPLYFKEGMGGISSPTPSGRSTLKRAVWLRWLSREASGPSWRELLVRLSEQRDQSSGSGSAQSVIPKGIFYSNPRPVEERVEQSSFAAAKARLEPWVDAFRYQAQDKFHFLNKAQRQVSDNLPEAQDAYLAELRYHGMAGAAIEDFQRDHVDPLLESIQKSGLTIDQVDDYLHARHAPEANAQLKRINPDREDNDALSGSAVRSNAKGCWCGTWRIPF